jgi:phosphoglucomutase
LILGLLSAEITARTGKDPGEHYRRLTSQFGDFYYTRIDAPATLEQRNRLKALSPDAVTDTSIAGDAVTAKLTKAPGNQAPVGGLKVVTQGGWFAARPSGTENIYKLYAESFRSDEHLASLVAEARQVVTRALGD